MDWEEEVERLERQLENYRHVVEQQESLIEVPFCNKMKNKNAIFGTISVDRYLVQWLEFSNKTIFETLLVESWELLEIVISKLLHDFKFWLKKVTDQVTLYQKPPAVVPEST